MTIQAEHHHDQDGQGRLFNAVYNFSMLFGRGGMARAVADLADISPNDVVVDVGCGPGSAARIARRAGASRVLGIDPSPDMLRLARWVSSFRRTDGVAFLEGSAESLPVVSSSATVVWALQSVHHWVDRSKGLAESRRILTPEGRLILLEGDVAPGVRGHSKHGLTDQQADELAALVGRSGFSNVTKRAVRTRRRKFVAITASVAPS